MWTSSRKMSGVCQFRHYRLSLDACAPVPAASETLSWCIRNQCEAYEGALQSIEDDEHIPKHGQVDQQCDEAEHPRQAHDRRQLDVETELVSVVAADALRISSLALKDVRK